MNEYPALRFLSECDKILKKIRAQTPLDLGFEYANKRYQARVRQIERKFEAEVTAQLLAELSARGGTPALACVLARACVKARVETEHDVAALESYFNKALTASER